MKISKIILYDEPRVPEIEITDLAKFITELFNVRVEIRNNIFEHFQSSEKIGQELASLIIQNPYSTFERHKPTIEEIELEEKLLVDQTTQNNLSLYEGFELQNFIQRIIPESNSNEFHIVFTTKIVCTYDIDDYRYHGRAIICSNPAIISTTGIVEAPAKPRAYYFGMYQSMIKGLDIDSLKNQFRGKFLEYHDKNLSKVIRGYVLQALFYYLTATPFCESKECMLYNAHWQEDLLYSQITIGRLCESHKEILETIRKSE